MPSKSKRVLIFGDSHLASVRHADTAGLLELGTVDLEYWGAAGPAFRQIHFAKEALTPIKPETEEMVLQVNGNGRKTVAANDFDVFVFYGVRLRFTDFFAPYLTLMDGENTAVSDAVLTRAADTFLNDRRSVRMAAMLKKAGAGRVILAFAGFPVWGVVDHTLENRTLARFPDVTQATVASRQRIWQALEAGLAARGLELVMQPEDTITKGMFTDPAFAVADGVEREDAVHKAPTFAAKLLNSLQL